MYALSLTNATKGQRAERVVHQHIIDRHSSARCLLDHPFYRLRDKQKREKSKCVQTSVRYCSHLLVGAEEVERQRLLPLVDESDGLIHVAHGHDRQQGAKDLLLHQPGVWGHVL